MRMVFSGLLIAHFPALQKLLAICRRIALIVTFDPSLRLDYSEGKISRMEIAEVTAIDLVFSKPTAWPAAHLGAASFRDLFKGHFISSRRGRPRIPLLKSSSVATDGSHL